MKDNSEKNTDFMQSHSDAVDNIGCDTQEVKDRTKLSKKSSVIILVSLFLVAVILAVIQLVDFDFLLSGKNDVPESIDYGYEFYTPDYTTDIMKDSDYTVLDREVWYQSGGIKTHPTDLSSVSGAAVIGDYLESLISGDAKKYASLFTREYLDNKNNTIPEKFPMQRIYNIEVVSLADPHTYTKDELNGQYTGITRYLFSVSYYIQYNTGTVRKDIPSDSSRPLYFEIFEYPDGTQKINSMIIYQYKN